MREKLRNRRSAAIFLVLGLLMGLLLLTPAGAHVGGTVGHLWKQHLLPQAKKSFYTKKQVNQQLPRAIGRVRDWPDSSTQAVAASAQAKVLEQTLKAPKAGAYLLNYTAWLEAGTATIGIMWLEMDQATPCTTGYFGAGHVPGTDSPSTLGPGSTDQTSAGTSVVPASKGNHVLTLCIHNIGANQLVIADASMNALFVGKGSQTVVGPGETAPPRKGLLRKN